MPLLLFVGGKDAAQERYGPHDRKEIRRAPPRRHVQGISASRKGECTHGKACHMSEAPALTIFIELGLRYGDFHHPAGSEGVPDSHNARSVGIWKRPQQQRIHNTEDRGGGANSKRQCEDADRSEARVSAQLSQRIANVLDETLEGRAGPGLTCLLPDEGRVAESTLRCVTGLLLRKATFPLLFLFQFQIRP